METYNDLPDSGRYCDNLGREWQYAQQVPTSPWRSAQSVARYLTLRQTTSDGLILVQQPISLVGLHDRQLFNGSAQISDSAPLNIPLQHNTSFEFETTVSADAKQQLNIDVRNRKGEKLTIGYDWNAQQLYVNRGDTRGFVESFFHERRFHSDCSDKRSNQTARSSRQICSRTLRK